MKERCIVIPAIKKNAVIPDQLVKKLAGVTLVERAVNTARGVLPGDDIVVLTDSQEIALICERAGVRHHWNKDLRFTSLDIVTEMRGLLTELAREYEHCMILRASCPLLTWVDVEDAWKRFREAQADSLVTVKSMRQRIWNVQGEGLESLLDEDAGHDSEKMLVVESRALIILRLALLDKANTAAFGDPAPAKVHTDIRRGPFIVVSGHDLEDLHQLLEQTTGTGVNVYTHSEMLPAHGYPGLRKYPQLAGNFGTAWQNQQSEFDSLPAPILMTTNCIMPPRPSYADRIYTTSVVGYPGLKHIPEDRQGRKDFSALIDQALALGGYSTDRSMSGINGGHILTTGFAHKALGDSAPAVIDAIKSGAVKHIFLVGGCDGAHPGRNYYTDFVKSTPMDSLILTLACGKFRFNDLDLGDINGIPRILDAGQCIDAYSAVQIALALADAFGCGVNDLPLTLVLSWYEQKAVCILLTLLALGIKRIYLGPTLPAFLSETVVKTLVDTYQLQPITHPQQDLDAILHRG